MKHLLPFILFVPFISVAQISIDVSDMSQVGDVITRKADTMSVLAGPGAAGANQTWNFTQLSTYVIDETTQVMNPSDAPNGSNFPSANLAMTNDNVNYLYFDQNANQMNTLGFAGDLLGNGTPIVAPFTSGLLVHNFPRTYGSNFTDNYVIDVTLDGSSISPLVNQVRFKRAAQIMDSTDAWGQLTTPVATYNSLRGKRTEFSADSIWIQAVFPPTWTLFQTSFDTTVSYQWYAEQGKLAIAELTFDSLGVPKKYTWFHEATVGNIIELNQNSSLNLYPNPSEGLINFELLLAQNENGVIKITDLSGKVMEERNVAPTSLTGKINTSSFANGIYFFEYSSSNSTKKVTQKFIVK
jgi:hypothetical protein